MRIITIALVVLGAVILLGVSAQLGRHYEADVYESMLEAERNKIDTTEIILNNEQLGLFRQGVDSAGAVSRNLLSILPFATITIEWENQCIIVRQSPIVPADSLGVQP